MLVYLDKLDKAINHDEFEGVVRKVCKQCGISNPNWLMIIMYAESNLKLISNSIGAYGYIQITPDTSQNDLGILMQDLRNLTWQQYLVYVSTYIQNRIENQKGVLPSNAYELYELIHYPISYKKPDSYVLYSQGSKSYNGNKGLDYNKDGKVINGEIKQFIDSKCPLFFDKSILLKPEDSTNYYYQNYQLTHIAIAFAIVIIPFLAWLYLIRTKKTIQARWKFSV